MMPEGKIRREKKMNRDIPKAKKHGKGIRFLLWLVIFMIAISGVLAYLKAIKLDQIVEKQSNKLVALQNDDPRADSTYDSHTMQLYVEDFIAKYINLPESQENRTAYQESLAPYYATGVEMTDVSKFSGYRVLQGLKYYDTKYLKNSALVQYKVAYENITVIPKERKKQEKYKDGKAVKVRQVVEKYNETQKQSVVAVLNVPVTAKDGQYAVTENVYFSRMGDLKSETLSGVTNPLDSEEEVGLSERDKVEQFLNDFFKKYAEAPTSDLMYVMKEPEGLDGLKNFVELRGFKAYPFKNEIIVKATPVFQDKGTDMAIDESMTLILSKKENSLFVEKLTHTMGGE